MTAALKDWSVGVIGLGLMGKPMAMNLYKAGARVTVTSRSAGPAEELAQQGLETAASPREIADRMPEGAVVIVMVTDTPALHAVMEGANGLLAADLQGKYVIDMGTSQVMDSRELAQQVQAMGGFYLDAPVSGGQVGAIEGSLSIMVGATEASFLAMTPIFEVLGARATHVGEHGAGQVAKSANQMIVGMTLDAVAEALSLAKAAGVDPAKVREALNGGFAGSRILELHGERMVHGKFEPGARITVQRKDMVQSCELAKAVNIDLPGLKKGREIWDQAVDEGLGEQDQAGIFNLFEKK